MGFCPFILRKIMVEVECITLIMTIKIIGGIYAIRRS